MVYEKPYGSSLESFHELDDLVQSVMKEDQVYRIDHFLGKEATQNIHVLRFANAMFNEIWCKEFISQVQIDVPETLDVADRAGFYDATGAFKDMIATHLFQVAAEVAMEPPISMAAENLQDARESVLAAFRPLSADDVVFGQYEGYLDLRRGGRGLDHGHPGRGPALGRHRPLARRPVRAAQRQATGGEQAAGVAAVPQAGRTDDPRPGLGPGPLPQGSGAIQAQLVLKKPGPDLELVEQRIDLALDHGRDADSLPPYVALLHDVTTGDRSLFTSSAGLLAAWTAAAPIVDHPPKPLTYRPGTWGPTEAERLTDGVGWLTEQS